MNEKSLLTNCIAIEGLTFAQVAMQLKTQPAAATIMRKGWVGQAIERLLGLENNSQAGPDFIQLGIELKTLPLNAAMKPTESTFVTGISLLNLHKETWVTSRCFAKLKRVLWVPVEGDKSIPFLARRIGKAFLWSPNIDEEQVLQSDWTFLTTLISLGRTSLIDAKLGEYLQVRPKAATGKSLTFGYNEKGQKELTLPRGFYLRTSFTAKIFKNQYIG
ncbi:MAG: DNA mismatch repair endonuclease MutH [Legionellales bacterium RIFCSPHIGHO2_12_FULL_37_14]|nr:MAG: DNA mismatch repair endonuclease MutH [Legionellales bacterium RIFCSPHIGHO2_12_FULL_37_14]